MTHSIKFFRNYCILLLTATFLVSCLTQSSNIQSTTAPQTSGPATPSPSPETIILQVANDGKTNLEKMLSVLPNLWTKIDKEKISFYPVNWLSDFTSAKDGSLWMVGGFGIIHQELNGQQTWYSIKNNLPVNFFSRVAIAPSGEVWVGGINNALFRFDGTQWVDEGIKLPPPFDTSTGWLCYSKNIAGIDFDQEGNAWVMNAGIEIYAQAYGQWVNFPFPKDILPWAGGGACPQGIRVISERNITIKRSGCCDSGPIGYHFDGKNWDEHADFEVVDDLFNARHKVNQQTVNIGLIENSGHTGWPFEKDALLPDYLMGMGSQEHLSLMTDNDGAIWLIGDDSSYNNINGGFEVSKTSFIRNSPYVADSKVPKFENEVAEKKAVIWRFGDNRWQKLVISDVSQPIIYLSQSKQGNIYAATDTGVYEIQGNTFALFNFVNQDSKPVVVSENGEWGNCKFNKNYTIAANCPGMWPGAPTFHYSVKLLSAQDDDSVIYVNNKIIAKFEKGKWKSFLFDTLNIESAIADKDGFIWAYTGANGLLRFSPSIFETYQELTIP